VYDLPIPRQRRLRKSEEGQALVLAALGMVVLMMMAGLGVDVGYLKYQKQQMQKAADAGALAGATALINYGGSVGQTQVIKAGRSDAAANGFANGQSGINVTVNNPPKTNGDPFQGNPAYVEVIVSQVRPTFFMRLAGYNSINVSSRAVATAVGSGSGCMYSLDPTDATTFQLQAGAQISSNCGILVGSSSGTALSIAGTVNTTASIGVVGDCTGTDCQTLISQNELTQGIAPFTDPLANVPPPTVPGCTFATTQYVTGLHNVLNQGGYCGGIVILTSGTVQFNPGTYFLEGGGMTVIGSPTFITGPANGSTNGVTFYNTSGAGGSYLPINMQNGTPSGSLVAPTSGPLAGILFFQDRSVQYSPGNGSYINGSRGAVYTGTFYFPTTALTYYGAKALDPYELMIAWQLTFKGNTTIENNYSSLSDGASPIANATLVE
jgi:Flp pilus assembly protein TadG